MCRFIGYLGSDLLLADVLVRPENSLIRQSYKARERPEPLNGDGFGVGWYSPAVADDPCCFRSISPAWGNDNLLSIADHVRSGCFFAHVRAASPGMAIAENNCHPFQIGKYLWMHNGSIQNFRHIKRRLCNSLSDALYDAVSGTTDSEHAFAMFLDGLGKYPQPSVSDMALVLVETIATLEGWVREAGINGPSIYNFAVTDGERMATVRYVSDPLVEPISLYFSKIGKYRCCNGRPRIEKAARNEGGVIIASEKLTDDGKDWVRVAPNHVLTVDRDLTTTVELVPTIGHV